MFSGFSLFPTQASTLAPEIDNLYLGIIAITAFFAIVVVVCVMYFAIKYRDETGEKVGAPITGSVPLELGWSLIPFFISIGIFVWASIVFFHIVRAPDQTLEVYSTGKRWMWRFQHIDGQREINELHVPVGRPVKLIMGSEDVIHSYYIPAFRVKADVIPGRYNMLWFTATKPGVYHLFCAEYCGTKHSGMVGSIVALDPADFQAWLSGGRADDSPVAAGAKLFQDLTCNTCHLTESQGRGPILTNVFGKPVELQNGQVVTADEAYIRESIVNPQAKVVAGFQPIMPTFQGLVSEEQLLQLIAYVKSLSQQGAAPGSGPASPTMPQSSGRPAVEKK